MQGLRVLIADNSAFFDERLRVRLTELLPPQSLIERGTDPVSTEGKITAFAPDVILMNYALAPVRLNGQPFLSRVTTEHSAIPVVIYGMLASNERLARSMGASAYVAREPFELGSDDYPQALAAAIKNAAINRRERPSTATSVGGGAIVTREIWAATKPAPKPAAPAPSISTMTAADALAAAGLTIGGGLSSTRPVATTASSVSASRPSNSRLASGITAGASSASASLHTAGSAASGATRRAGSSVEAITASTRASLRRNGFIHDVVTPPEVQVTPASGPVQLIAMGSSTGGTEALTVVLTELKPPLPPIVIVQHIPPMFSRLLAERLNSECSLAVKEAETGDRLQNNHIYIAPGSKHMTVHRTAGNLTLDCRPGPPVHSVCPSVDILFDSIARLDPGRVVGIILTGMGRDGAEGLLHLREKGAHTIGQDQLTSAVYGMPKAAYELGAVAEQLPLGDIAAAITRTVKQYAT